MEVRRQVVELARSGTRVSQLAETFGMTQASIYSWLKQERIDGGWSQEVVDTRFRRAL